MADVHHPQHQMQQHQHGQPMGATIKNMLPDKGPSTAQVLAVVTLFPIGGILLTIAGLTLTGTVVGLAITTPLFILFSPVLVPAAITIGLAVTGFLASGAFGLTALSSLSWIINYVRGSRVPETLEAAKRRMQETAGHVGQKTKEVGQQVQGKAHEGGR